jgi:hypothetical protein
MISETLNAQVAKFILEYLFADDYVKAYVRLIPNAKKSVKDEIALYRDL